MRKLSLYNIISVHSKKLPLNLRAIYPKLGNLSILVKEFLRYANNGVIQMQKLILPTLMS